MLNKFKRKIIKLQNCKKNEIKNTKSKEKPFNDKSFKCSYDFWLTRISSYQSRK